jgi:hypothetical protein
MDTNTTISFTKNEYNLYTNQMKQNKKPRFTSPDEEYEWIQQTNQTRTCSKCNIEKSLSFFNGNTSGADGFDKSGLRLRRPECSVCTKTALVGKSMAKKWAKQKGIPYKAPEGTTCAICKKPPTKGNVLVFDHCHKKNIFRGYCCNSCNRSLGVLGDNIEGLLNVVNYIMKTEPEPIRILQREDGVLEVVGDGSPSTTEMVGVGV